VRQEEPEEDWAERESQRKQRAKGEKWLRRGRRRVQRRRRPRKLAWRSGRWAPIASARCPSW